MWLSFVLIGIFVILLLYFNPILYKTPWAIERWIEISLVLLFSYLVSKVDYHQVLTVAKARIEMGNFSTIEPEMMKVVDEILVYEYSGILYTILLAIFIIHRLTREEYNTSLNFDELLNELSKHFRFARCMIHLDPTKGAKVLDFTKTAFRLKEEIIPFFKRHNAIGTFRFTPTSEESFYMIRDKADAACLRTLGRRFKSVDDLHYYEKWLFAVFCLKLKSKKYGEDQEFKDAETILGDISYHLNGEGNLKRVNQMTNAALKKYRNDPEIVKYCNSHSFVSGVLKQLYHQAKSRGVHPSFHFNWLYTVDRTLMLVLDETGMPDERGGVVEVASPESGIECLYPRLHWTNEKKAGTRLFEPACSYIMDYIEDYLVKTYGFVKETEALAVIAEQKKRFEKQGEEEQVEA
jgi:hypothetical protein